MVLEKNISELRKINKPKLNLNKNKIGKKVPIDIETILKKENAKLLLNQAKLENFNEEYAELFEYAPVGYFILNKKGIIRNVNIKGCFQLGATKEQIIGKAFSIFPSSESYKKDFFKHRNLVHKTEKLQKIESVIKKTDGTEFPVLITSNIAKDKDKKFKHFLSMTTDISERIKQERNIKFALLKEKELSEMKSQFISLASHEFRTPLSTILTSAELIEKYKDPANSEKRDNHFRKIKTAVNRIREILMDFMSANEIEEREIKNRPETFDLVEFTENIISETKTFDGKHAVKYKHTSKTQKVYLDKKLLKTCLSNLIINAYKYSPNSNEIEIITSKKAANNITISIKDYGIGIPENEQIHLFEKFFRAKNADAIQGTGLGLNITRGLTTIMGGKITFKSKLNQGSTFILNFF